MPTRYGAQVVIRGSVNDLLGPLCRQLEPMTDPAGQTVPHDRTKSPLAASQSPAPGATALGLTALGSTTGLGSTVGATAREGAMQEPYQPNLSKHEKQLLQQAHERHQASITSPQVCLHVLRLM